MTSRSKCRPSNSLSMFLSLLICLPCVRQNPEPNPSAFIFAPEPPCLTLKVQIIQKLGFRGDTRDKQMIPRTRAGDLQQMAFGVVNLFQISVVCHSLDARLQGNDLIRDARPVTELLRSTRVAAPRMPPTCAIPLCATPTGCMHHTSNGSTEVWQSHNDPFGLIWKKCRC
jgi:hypothetical protein